MTDQDVRDFLERMATEEPVPFVDPQPLARRARRRAARTAVVGVIGVAAAVALVFAGASQLRVAPPNIPVTVPTAAPRPSPAPGFSTFSSPLHGITIDYPAGWTVRPATESWTHGTVTFDASNVDVIFDPSLGDDVYLALVSEPLGGEAGPDWVGGEILSTAGICADATGGNGGSFTLDGAAGWIGNCGSPSAGGSYLMVATDTRGYLIYLHKAHELALQDTYDFDFFENLLETVDLEPVATPGDAEPNEVAVSRGSDHAWWSRSASRESLRVPRTVTAIVSTEGWQG